MAKVNKDDELHELIAGWVCRLGLQEWDITVVSDCTMSDIKKILETDEVATGACEWCTLLKTAKVAILAEDEYPKMDDSVQWMAKYDYEETLVHELLHIKFSLWADNIKDGFIHDWFHQQCIEDMAKALVSAKREGEKRGRLCDS